MKLTSAFEKGSLLGERVWIVDTLFRIIHFKCCAKMCTSHKHLPFVLTEFGLFRISCRTHIFVCSSLWRVICLLNNKIVVSVSTAPVAVALNYFWITNGVILLGNVLDQRTHFDTIQAPCLTSYCCCLNTPRLVSLHSPLANLRWPRPPGWRANPSPPSCFPGKCHFIVYAA